MNLTPSSTEPVSALSTTLGVPSSNSVFAGFATFDGEDAGPVPIALVAVTRNV